jgi:hypothetical protein
MVHPVIWPDGRRLFLRYQAAKVWEAVSPPVEVVSKNRREGDRNEIIKNMTPARTKPLDRRTRLIVGLGRMEYRNPNLNFSSLTVKVRYRDSIF